MIRVQTPLASSTIRWYVRLVCFWMVCILSGVVSVKMTQAVDASPLHIPSTKVRFPNGLTVVVSTKHKLPLAFVHVRIKAGAAHDPEDKAGLAALTARLLDKGTMRRPAAAIAEEVDFLGAQLGASVGGIDSRVALALLAKDVESGLDLLADLLQHPRFDPAELEREREQMLSEIHQRRMDAEQAVVETFRGLLYDGHPLHRPIAGYPETVSQLTRADVLAFHQRFYGPQNAIVVMVGDFPEAQMLALLERYLGPWQSTAAEPPALPQPAPTRGKRVRVVDMEVNQTYIQLGQLAVRRADPAFVSLRALNYILGSGAVSRLERVIREEQGWAYAASSEVVGGSEVPGYWGVELQTKTETTAQALSSLFAVLERLKQEAVTAEELTDMKQFYAGSLPSRAETYAQVADLLLEREVFGLPDGFWAAEIAEMQQLTAEDLQRTAKRYLDTEHFVLALVSKREELSLAGAPIPPDAITDSPAP